MRTLFPELRIPIDLTAMERLNNSTQRQKMLLTFNTPQVPALLFQQKFYLNSRGIFLIRIFASNNVVPLLPNLQQFRRLEKIEEWTIKFSPMKTSVPEHSQIEEGLLAVACGPLTNNSCSHLENSIEKNLIISFLIFTTPEKKLQ